MADWRISEQNPIRGTPGLDHERCAALHNLIVERGWAQSSRSLDDLDRRTWWDIYASSDALPYLDASVVAFLKVAQQGHMSVSPQHDFHRYAAGLCAPAQMHDNALFGPDEDSDSRTRYITLYMANYGLMTSHPLGVVYDQETHSVFNLVSGEHTLIAMNGRQQWPKLEEILENFLGMMDEGKVLAVDQLYRSDQEPAPPWIMPSFTRLDLCRAIAAWNCLIDEIEQRTASEGMNVASLREAIATAQPEEGSFATLFAQAARSPSFLYLAPGLRIARSQPFATVDSDYHTLRPILLLESDRSAQYDNDRLPSGRTFPLYAFDPDYQRGVFNVPAGLYLTEADKFGPHPYEVGERSRTGRPRPAERLIRQDGVKLLLPYTIGSNGWARRSDGSCLGEALTQRTSSPRHTPRSTELYQSGQNPFVQNHDVQLYRVLERWADMVRSGSWQVDGNGVMGGIEKWREADAANAWQDYVLARAR